MFHVCGLYVSCLRPLCFMLAASIYDTWLRQGEDCVLGRKEAIRALAVLCGFERRACKQRGWEAGLKHRGWVRAFVLVLWGLVLFGRAFRGSCFWSFFSWFVLLGSFFWFVLLGARMCFFFDALKFLEACVARSEVS